MYYLLSCMNQLLILSLVSSSPSCADMLKKKKKKLILSLFENECKRESQESFENKVDDLDTLI
jgi:hypothetical protein